MTGKKDLKQEVLSIINSARLDKEKVLNQVLAILKTTIPDDRVVQFVWVLDLETKLPVKEDTKTIQERILKNKYGAINIAYTYFNDGKGDENFFEYDYQYLFPIQGRGLTKEEMELLKRNLDENLVRKLADTLLRTIGILICGEKREDHLPIILPQDVEWGTNALTMK